MQLYRRISPALRLSFSVTLLILSIISASAALGLLPDSVRTHLQARARVAEALTIQLAAAATRKDFATIRETISALVQRDPEVKSIAIRARDGATVAASPEHAKLWEGADPDRSTQTHVRVPVADGASIWGTVEIVFAPYGDILGRLGISSELLLFALVVGVTSFAGIYLILRFALRQLDPAKSVPNRVQNAFDSLSDGVAVIDEKDTILLVNQSLASMLGGEQKKFLGGNLSRLLWRHWNGEGRSQELPWMAALRNRTSVRDVPMNLRSQSGAMFNVMVNASCIYSDEGKIAGALVTFKDVTVLERKNMDLSLAYNRLQHSEIEIKKQNSQLKYLASHDPMTSCMNRRALFDAFSRKFEAALENGGALTCMMIDIDHFKSVNDTYGHATGDKVIAGLAQLLRETCREQDIVGRYGGEEFCMVLDGLTVDKAARIAARVREQMKTRSRTWLNHETTLSVSIGIAAADADAGSVGKAVDNADQALYAAKKSGRDRAVVWQSTMTAKPVTVSSGVSDDHRPADKRMPSAPRDVDKQASLLVTPLDRFLGGLRKSITQSKREKKAVAVICVNLDSLEEYSDAFGPVISSGILVAVEARLNAIFCDADTVSLLSGQDRSVNVVNVRSSRFLIQVANIDDTTSVAWILQRLSEKLAAPLRQNDQGMPLRFSIGASLYPNDGLTPNEVVQNAVLAQKKALETTGDRSFRMFSNDMFEMVHEQLRVEKGIRAAISRKEFHLHFQPIVDLVGRSVSGAEVLLRSTNRYLQNTSIDSVIQVAEKTGLIHQLSNHVFETAFATLHQWRTAGVVLPLISINISAKQLENAEIVYKILQLAEKYAIEPSSIQLEMTETAIVSDVEKTSKILRTLQNYGFHIALDDFGTGGSSLSHLLQIKPDAIKIDKSFVHSLTDKYTNNILVATITELSRKIGAKVIAEGVETNEQLEEIMGIGCQYVQGYLFSKPLPADVFRQWLELSAAEALARPSKKVPPAGGSHHGVKPGLLASAR